MKTLPVTTARTVTESAGLERVARAVAQRIAPIQQKAPHLFAPPVAPASGKSSDRATTVSRGTMTRDELVAHAKQEREAGTAEAVAAKPAEVSASGWNVELVRKHLERGLGEPALPPRLRDYY